MNKKKTQSDLYDFDIRYENEKDKRNTINTDSVLERKERLLHQYYTGLYYQKCYHNTGRCKWIDGNEEYVYEGKLYANDLHGYGKLVYPDNSKYEGLFYHNKRFGPGVVTYPGGDQDVGLWNGKYLIRLSQNIDLADFFLENIPSIAKTVAGKLFLLKFKEVVTLVDDKDPVANLAKKYQLSSEDCEKLYSKCIRNHKSIFMNRSLFDRNFYTDPKELSVDVVNCYDENEEPVINKMTATSLLAWNNEKTCIDIMKHAFMNRKYEKVTSYKIRNAFLPNRRDTFMNEGPIEQMCLKLLAACRDDDTVNISKLISDYDLHPDVTDCFGNTPIMYAAMANKRNAIKTLVNFGANVNIVNDESMSALMLCVLQYIAMKNDILESNWETAFLQLKEELGGFMAGRIWPTGSSSNSSVESVSKNEFRTTISEKSSVSARTGTSSRRGNRKTKRKSVGLINKEYVFNLIYKAPSKETIARKHMLLRRKLKLSKIYRKTIKCDKTEGMENVMKTIRTLIKCGADVNVCSVPHPPLISALFSDNVEMVHLFLESNVDVNQRTRESSGSLNPLHIVCAMDNSPNQEVITTMLINYGADVNARSSIKHWEEARDKLLAGEPLLSGNEDLGKTPFHVLAMRYDFDQDTENRIVNVAKKLVENGADATEQYLGHNVLSLAALRGNVNLMEYILSNVLCDPNENLGNNMGVPLTMLTLRKFSKSLPVSDLKRAAETLTKYNANPFNKVPNFDGNAIEFAIASDKESPNSLGKNVGKNVGLNVLLDLSASILRRYIDSRALQLLFNSQICQQRNNNIPAGMILNVVKYLDIDKACKILQILLDNFRISPNFDLCMKLLNFVQSRTGKGKLKISLIDKTSIRTYVGDESTKSTLSRPTQFEMTKTLVQIKLKSEVYELDFNREDKEDLVNPYKEHMPELDTDHEKYKVCYECLERANKTLQLCPYCKLVYFCSIICNIKKNQSKEHPCKKVFYATPGESASKLRARTRRSKLASRASDNLDLDVDYVVDADDVDNDDKDDDDDDDDYDFDDTLSSDEYDSEGNKKKKKKKRRGRKRIKRRQWYKSKSRVIKIGRKICTSSCTGKLIAIDFKEPLEEVERRLRAKYKRPEIMQMTRGVWSNLFNCKFALNERNIDSMLRVAKRVNLQLVPILDDNQVLNPCDPFDYKFWHLFLPYCVFQNGELFYRSNDTDLLYKLPFHI